MNKGFMNEDFKKYILSCYRLSKSEYKDFLRAVGLTEKISNLVNQEEVDIEMFLSSLSLYLKYLCFKMKSEEPFQIFLKKFNAIKEQKIG